MAEGLPAAAEKGKSLFRAAVVGGDLMSFERIRAGVEAAGGRAQPAEAAEISPEAFHLALVDLMDPGAAASVEQLVRLHPRLPIMAVGPHKDQALLDRAREAGAHRVITHQDWVRHGHRSVKDLLPTALTGGPTVGIAPDDTVYDSIALPPPPEHRPYTILNMVSTVDGKVTLEGGRVQEIGSDVDHRFMRKIRVPVDAVLRGASTVRGHGRFPGVPPAQSAARRAQGLPDQPRIVIVTGSGRLPLDRPIFTEAPEPPVVLMPEDADPQRKAGLARVAVVEEVGRERVDLAAAMTILRHKYGIRALLSEGGPHLNFGTLEKGLLDEMFWTVAPKVAGSRDDLTMVTGDGVFDPLPALDLHTAWFYAATGELFLRYRVKPGGAR